MYPATQVSSAPKHLVDLGVFGLGVIDILLDNGNVEHSVGCLYGWNTVLTCAHVLQRPYRKVQAVTFAASSSSKTRLTFNALWWKCSASYDPLTGEGLDLAVIVLEDGRACRRIGWSLLAEFSEEKLSANRITVFTIQKQNEELVAERRGRSKLDLADNHNELTGHFQHGSPVFY